MARTSSLAGRREAPLGPLTVVKLGGSVITRKREREKLRPKILARLAAELATAGERPLIVLHGAGGFGHPGAVRFGLAGPPDQHARPQERSRGSAIVSAEVRRLHLAVLRAMVDAGSKPWSVPVSTHAVQRAGLLETIDLDPFETTLESGLVPVSFGDVVPDAEWGSSILSADRIAVALAGRFHPRAVLFVSDVPGILEGKAGKGSPQILPEVTDETARSLRPAPGARDVTGGILGKVAAMREIARLGVDAALISGVSDGTLSRALTGARVYGSWARAEPR